MAGVVGRPESVTWVDTPEGMAELAQSLEGITELALDIETTGLNPDQDRVRLIQLAWQTPEKVQGLAIVDLFAFSDPATALAPLLQRLSQVTLIGHHLAFDLPFLMRLGFSPDRPPFDTMLASQILHAGEHEDSGRPLSHDLATVLIRELRIKLDKSLQKSDWSGELTPAQIDYAIADVQHLLPLAEKLRWKLEAGKLTQVAATEMHALLTIVRAQPIRVDRQAWTALAQEAKAEVARLLRELNTIVIAAGVEEKSLWDSLGPDAQAADSGINWNSPQQVREVFQRLGISLPDTRDETLAAVDHPLAEKLRQYRAVQKRRHAFGENWLREYASDGWVRPCWHQLGAESGRMSCSEPNLQQIPRTREYRRCFIPRDGCLFIKADYSQIELRLAAKVANEERMILAFQEGEDLHRLTAARLLDKPLDRVEKADRQLAKAVNFGLLYGMSPRGLQTYARANYDMELSLEEAKRLHREFFRTYPGLQAWHDQLIQELERCGPEGTYAARTLFGRRRFIPAYHHGRPNLTEVANFQVQGLAADGLKRALAWLWEHQADRPEAHPVLFVHDEIVIEVSAERAEEAREWLIAGMHEGMQSLLDPVPCEVEAVIASSWVGEPCATTGSTPRIGP